MRVRNVILAIGGVIVVGGLIYWQVAPGETARKPAGSSPDRSAEDSSQSLVTPTPRRPAVTAPTPEAPPSDDDPPVTEEETGPAPFEVTEEEARVVKLLQSVEELEMLYDRSDYAGVVARGKDVLLEHPDNIRVLRVVVSSACVAGDGETARRYAPRIYPPVDRKHVEMTCRQHGVSLSEE